MKPFIPQSRDARNSNSRAGGIIALGLVHGVPLADIRARYERRRAGTSDSWLNNLKYLWNVVGA